VHSSGRGPADIVAAEAGGIMMKQPTEAAMTLTRPGRVDCVALAEFIAYPWRHAHADAFPDQPLAS